MRPVFLLSALPLWAAAGPPDLAKILERVSEEAEIFQQNAAKVIATERLLHRGRRSPSRFKPSEAGEGAPVNASALVEREIVSEYGFAPFHDAPASIHEFRQVVTVDGQPVKEIEKARESLVFNMKSDDDRLRRKMLQDFEKLGMVGAATDFGQLLLMFRRGALDRYEFSLVSGRNDRAGTEKVLVVSYLQKESGEGARVFHGRRMAVIPAKGEIWVREADYLPVRVTIEIPSREENAEILHAGETDYERIRHGILLPRAVRYTRKEGQLALVENFAFYNDHRMFKVESSVKFSFEEVKPQ